jgi:hypothetical protein
MALGSFQQPTAFSQCQKFICSIRNICPSTLTPESFTLGVFLWHAHCNHILAFNTRFILLLYLFVDLQHEILYYNNIEVFILVSFTATCLCSRGKASELPNFIFGTFPMEEVKSRDLSYRSRCGWTIIDSGKRRGLENRGTLALAGAHLVIFRCLRQLLEAGYNRQKDKNQFHHACFKSCYSIAHARARIVQTHHA